MLFVRYKETNNIVGFYNSHTEETHLYDTSSVSGLVYDLDTPHITCAFKQGKHYVVDSDQLILWRGESYEVLPLTDNKVFNLISGTLNVSRYDDVNNDILLDIYNAMCNLGIYKLGELRRSQNTLYYNSRKTSSITRGHTYGVYFNSSAAVDYIDLYPGIVLPKLICLYEFGYEVQLPAEFTIPFKALVIGKYEQPEHHVNMYESVGGYLKKSQYITKSEVISALSKLDDDTLKKIPDSCFQKKRSKSLKVYLASLDYETYKDSIAGFTLAHTYLRYFKKLTTSVRM